MVKNILLFFAVSLLSLPLFSQQNIEDARRAALSETVTLSGIATNGGELGLIRYFQDETAGLAVYSDLTADLKPGDSITVVGSLKDYNNLLEVDPVVITGSHNWSNAANTTNDENTLLIHSSDIANQYYQNFVARFEVNNGNLATQIDEWKKNSLLVFPNPAADILNITCGKDTSRIEVYSITDTTEIDRKNRKYKHLRIANKRPSARNVFFEN